MGFFARFIVFVMGIMSVASLMVTAERLLVYLKSKKDSLAFAAKIGPVLASGDLPGAGAFKADTNSGHLGRVIAAGVHAFNNAPVEDPEYAFESVSRALERQAQREVANLKRGQGVLATVSATAPFVGLLGTVMGIVNSFQMMAESGSGGLGTVSAGIAEALVTTAFGLLVAIPAVMAFNYLNTWVDAAALDISESSNELLDLVARTLRHGNAQGAPGVVTRSGFMGRYDEKKSGTGTH
jgi:biopolymer transport protein ExbB/biopolymer transport protein TolQ